MPNQLPNLPQVGDVAPAFEVQTTKGCVRFPDYNDGGWCIIFAHPANFTSAWTMFSAFLAMKERWLNERNTKVLAITNESLKPNNDWSDKARRFIGIYLKAPVIEDLDFQLSRMFGLASGRRPQPGLDRLALIIDPQGIIRMIIHRPLPNIESALLDIERELDRLQKQDGNPVESKPQIEVVMEQSDASGLVYKAKPAHFPRKRFAHN
ncbi:MAG: redoxin domain-containing protein [Saprospiraceae bacterium]|nr:redoxin domain-containing protein [Saprospiraceae bacterium]